MSIEWNAFSIENNLDKCRNFPRELTFIPTKICMKRELFHENMCKNIGLYRKSFHFIIT